MKDPNTGIVSDENLGLFREEGYMLLKGLISPEMLELLREDGSNDLVGYRGDDPGVAIELPVGSVAVFSSYNLQRSGANTTNHMRRVYLPQCVSDTIHLAHNGEQLNMSVPFIRAGEIVYDHHQDTAQRWGGAAAPEMS